MSPIKQLILLHQQGKGRKTIARVLSMSKNTVKSYLDKLQHLTSQEAKGHSSVTIKALLKMEDPVLEAKFHPGNPAYKDHRYAHFKSKVAHYLQELKRTGVSRQLLWKEYRAENPQGYSYSQFCFHLHQQRVATTPSMVLHHQAGDKLFIDFAGKPLSYIDKQSGELVNCPVFVACLPYSDYSFAMAVPSQSTVDFIHALTRCLHHLGGVPAAIVPDNLKAAVVKAHRYEPTINQVLESFANHYGTTIIPARARKPQDKALVENQVKLLYSRVYAPLRHRQFFDLPSLNEAITTKVKAHNQTRMQEKPYCREEQFLAQEQKRLMPLPVEHFEIKHYSELTVAKNNHVYLSEDKHYYSVPFALIGSKVKVIYTRSLVYLFSKGEQVAVHIRDFKPGSYTTHKDHLCSTHQHYRDRSPAYYTQQALKKSPALHQLVQRIFQQNRYPEQLYRTCDGLFSLHRKTASDVFERACQMALDYQNYTYTFLKNILNNNMADQEAPWIDKPLPAHPNLRGKDYYH